MKHIPNILTTIRFLLVFVYLTIFYSDIEHNVLFAMLIFIIAGITDILDGFIARRYKLITKFGQVMDPFADKSMQMTVLLTLSFAGYIQKWIVYVFIAKELFMIISGLVLYLQHTKIVIPSNIFGKIATVLIYIAIILSVLEFNMSKVIFIAVLAYSLITLLQYIWIGIKKIKISLFLKKLMKDDA